MNKNIFYMAITIAFLSCGCFSSSPKKSLSMADPSAGVTGQIIKENELKKGGTLAILPFKAGVNAAATQQLDRMSLMMVKGMIDYLAEERTPFKVLTTADQGQPDLVIDGYINNFSQPGKMKRLVHSKKAVLSVDGYMEISKTKERILVFQHERKMTDPKKDGLELAYRTGQDLGRFIVEALQ